MPTLTITIADAEELEPEQRAAIIALCEAAFDEPFGQLFALLPGSRHVLVDVDGQLVSHACWVTRMLQPTGGPLLRTAYVEAVATLPAWQGRGYGTLAMERLVAETAGYDLRALSAAVPEFYTRQGWEGWCGPLAIRTADGLLATPDEEIMLLRTAQTPPLDPGAMMTAEWRDGELW